jgi:hypothetical protein
VETPIKSSGHLQILYGNLAPQGSGAPRADIACLLCLPAGRCLLFAQAPIMRRQQHTLALAPPLTALPPPALPRPAPSAVGKITGKEGLVFEGKALCFDCEEDMLKALEKDQEQFKVCAGEGVSLLRERAGWCWGHRLNLCCSATHVLSQYMATWLRCASCRDLWL